QARDLEIVKYVYESHCATAELIVPWALHWQWKQGEKGSERKICERLEKMCDPENGYLLRERKYRFELYQYFIGKPAVELLVEHYGMDQKDVLRRFRHKLKKRSRPHALLGAEFRVVWTLGAERHGWEVKRWIPEFYIGGRHKADHLCRTLMRE